MDEATATANSFQQRAFGAVVEETGIVPGNLLFRSKEPGSICQQNETSRQRDPFALSQLCGVIALTMLFLVLQGMNLVASGQHRRVDA